MLRAGSYGHFQASKSGVNKGDLKNPLVKAGFVATRISVSFSSHLRSTLHFVSNSVYRAFFTHFFFNVQVSKLNQEVVRSMALGKSFQFLHNDSNLSREYLE